MWSKWKCTFLSIVDQHAPVRTMRVRARNDLPNCLSNCQPRMYADDTHFTYAGDCVDNLQLYLNQDLENVHNWLRENKLTLNTTKTEFMLIGSRQRLSTFTDSPTITNNDNQVSQVTTAKSLGVTIDNKHDWRSHTDKLTKKVASGIGAVKRIRHLVPKATLHLIQVLIQHILTIVILFGETAG